MSEYSGRTDSCGRVALVVSRYHERLTRKLLDGAVEVCSNAGMTADAIDVIWVAGTFELGVVTAQLTRGGRYGAVVALGVVIRGETPHFDFVAGESAAALSRAASETGVPVGFGLLTTDDLAQAEARSGGNAGNKGKEAALAALNTASLLRQIGNG